MVQRAPQPSPLYHGTISTIWFYRILDSTRSKQNGRRQEANQANRTNNSRGNNRNNRSGRNATQKPCVAYTGPNMVMEPGMRFSPADWAKLTKAQKSKIFEFKKQKRAPASTANVSVNNANTNPAPTTNPTTTTAPSSTTTNNCDIRQLLSNNTSRDSSSVPSSIVVDGRTYTLSYCARTYSLHQQLQSPCGSLIDGGANGGLSGSDVVVLSETLLTADVTGIADNTLTQIPICTVAGLIQTQHGPIIGIFHQYAHQGTGKTIHSVSQLRHFGTIVDDTPRQFGGKQRLEALDGYIIPLSIRSGLPYMDMSPPTQEELDTYPHVFFTSDMEWHPQSVNDEYHVADLDITEDDLQVSDYHPDVLDVTVPSFALLATTTSTYVRYNRTNLT